MDTPDKHIPLVIVYHAACIDGAAAAYAVGRAHAGRADVTLVPYAHFEADASEARVRAALKAGAEVIFADVAPRRAFFDEIAMYPGLAAARILDHHGSAAAAYAGYAPPPGAAARTSVHIAPGEPSAAGMIWRLLLQDEAMPPVFALIDRLDGSARLLKTLEDFAAAAYVDAQDLRAPATAMRTMDMLSGLSFAEMAWRGTSLAAAQEEKIDALLRRSDCAFLRLAPGGPVVGVPLVNADVRAYGRGLSVRMVALGNDCGAGAAFLWHVQDSGCVAVSIRTCGTPDASKIAAHLCDSMGIIGGGHADAAAVQFPSYDSFARHMGLPGAQARRVRAPRP